LPLPKNWTTSGYNTSSRDTYLLNGEWYKMPTIGPLVPNAHDVYGQKILLAIF
jgi:hypothetical protein